MKIKRDKLDDVFSKLIRERDDHTCQRCHVKPDGRLDCSHIYSRRHKNTRWMPLNATSHCFSCHQYLGENPLEFDAWARAHLGPVLYEELRQAHRVIRKWTKADKAEMYEHYKGELARLQELRSEGRAGYIEVVAYE